MVDPDLGGAGVGDLGGAVLLLVVVVVVVVAAVFAAEAPEIPAAAPPVTSAPATIVAPSNLDVRIVFCLSSVWACLMSVDGETWNGLRVDP